MIGITPAALILRGMYWRTPPYCLLPITLFAYCTGTLLTPCTSAIAATYNETTPLKIEQLDVEGDAIDSLYVANGLLDDTILLEFYFVTDMLAVVEYVLSVFN